MSPGARFSSAPPTPSRAVPNKPHVVQNRVFGSALNLGVCYGNGQGVEKDYVEAVKWLRKAAEQNNAKAQLNLGLCYGNDQGVEKDYGEAVKWYRKAAEQNDAKAQLKGTSENLSLCDFMLMEKPVCGLI